MRTPLVALAALSLPLAYGFHHATNAASFSVKDPKGVNAIQFSLDGRIEQLTGHTRGIDGQITFDPDTPEATSGEISFATDSLTMANPTMTEHLHSARWLNAEANPTISFKIVEVTDVKRISMGDAMWKATVTGNLMLNGTTKRITFPATATHLPGQLQMRNRVAGDLMVLRSRFAIRRSDFGISGGGVPTDIVADRIQVDFSIGAFRPQ